MSTLLGTTKEGLISLLIGLISLIVFLIVGDILTSLSPGVSPVAGGMDSVKLIGIFYVFPFYVVASFLRHNAILQWGRFALFLVVSYAFWANSFWVESVLLVLSFMLSFACMLGLEKAKRDGVLRVALFKIFTGVVSYVVFAIPVALGMRGLLWNLDVGSASDYMFEVYAFYTFLPICLALPFITHIFPLRVALIAIALLAPLLGISSAGISWVALYIGAMALSIIFSQVVTSRCHFLNSGTHALKH